MVLQHFNKVQPCSAQPAVLSKSEFTLELTEGVLKILMHPQKTSLTETSLQQKYRSRVYSCDLL